jgi:hypothetical protein
MFRSGDIEKVRRLVEAYEQEYPQELSDTDIIHGGGMNPFRTLKKHFTNKRTGIVGKTLGLPTTAVGMFGGSLLRQPLYSPYADEVYDPWDNGGVLSHELGHAIDYNSEPIDKDTPFIKKQWSKLKRDMYPVLRNFPGGSLYQEAKAWDKATDTNNKILKKHVLPEEDEERLINQTSQAYIPMFSSYINTVLPSNPATPFLPHALGLSSAGKNQIKEKLLKDVPERESKSNPEKDDDEKPNQKKDEDEDKKKEASLLGRFTSFIPNEMKDRVKNGIKKIINESGGYASKLIEPASYLGRRVSDQLLLGAGTTAGAILARRLLEGGTENRQREAERRRSRRKNGMEEITQDQDNNRFDAIDEDIKRLEELRLLNNSIKTAGLSFSIDNLKRYMK